MALSDEQKAHARAAREREEKFRPRLRPVTRELTALIEKWLGEHFAHEWQRDLVQRLHALPLLGTMGGAFLLRPDGKMLCVVDSIPHAGIPEQITDAEPAWQVVAVVHAVRRYAELSELLPIRPANAKECLSCAGSGWVAPLPNMRPLCCDQCFGLGWIDAEDDAQPPRRPRPPKNGPYR